MLARWTRRGLPIPAPLCVPMLIRATPLIFLPALIFLPPPVCLPPLICVARRRALLCLRIGCHRRGRGTPANQ